MKPITLSSKFQFVIPKEVRDRLDLRPGQKFRIFTHRGHIELVPVRSPEELRGTLKGIDTRVEREPDREL